jgi:hypothetical protein
VLFQYSCHAYRSRGRCVFRFVILTGGGTVGACVGAGVGAGVGKLVAPLGRRTVVWGEWHGAAVVSIMQ